MENSLKAKEKRLRSIIADAGSAVVAFSGGVDSALLAVVTHQVLGDAMIAVTGVSPSLPDFQLKQAKDLADQVGLPLTLIETNELDNPAYTENNAKRCYYCKHTLFATLTSVARQHNINTIFDGSNADDADDYRPGMVAADEFNVISPLAQAELTKDDIRAISKELDLPTWNVPAFACLSSRFPYGEHITAERLEQVGKAEAALRELGFRNFRVRHHDTVARVELSGEELPRALNMEMFTEINARLRCAGYLFVAIDTAGYRSGSMNSMLARTDMQQDD